VICNEAVVNVQKWAYWEGIDFNFWGVKSKEIHQITEGFCQQLNKV
jgi:hypothetical protein